MICPGCLKDVPELIGPDQLCPCCLEEEAEFLLPHILPEEWEDDPWAVTFPDSPEGFWQDLEEECCEDEPHWLSTKKAWTEPGDFEDDRMPTFRGRPRF
jgi:hypothetical protein